MRIELRRLSYSEALSKETAAYAAEIWINGERAFHARNQGHGGCDLYHQIGRWTEIDVNDWLKANRPPRIFDGMTFEHDLETEVSILLDFELQLRRVKRMFRSYLVTIEDGAVYQYKLAKRPAAVVEMAIRARRPGAVIVNGANDDVVRQAVEILLRSADAEASGNANA